MPHSIGGTPLARCALLLVAFAASARPGAAQGWVGRAGLEAERCLPAAGDPRSWLAKADSAVGLPALGNRVLSFQATESNWQFFQSDRMYPPFIGQLSPLRFWYDAASGTERFGPPNASAGREIVRSDRAVFGARDSALAPVPSLFSLLEPYRTLNPRTPDFFTTVTPRHHPGRRTDVPPPHADLYPRRDPRPGHRVPVRRHDRRMVESRRLDLDLAPLPRQA
jgi:hypothetical protein